MGGLGFRGHYGPIESELRFDGSLGSLSRLV